MPLRREIADLDRAALQAEGRAFFGFDPARAVLLVTGLVLAPGAVPAPAVKRALVTWEVTGERFRTYLLRPADVARVKEAIRLGEVVTAVARSGLRLEAVAEHPVDWWGGHGDVAPDERGRIPLSFSIVARR